MALTPNDLISGPSIARWELKIINGVETVHPCITQGPGWT